MSYINTAKYPIPIFDRNNEDCQLWTRDAIYYAKHCNFGSDFKEDAEAPVVDTNLDRRGLLAAGYDEEDRPANSGLDIFYVGASVKWGSRDSSSV